jgi:hypothetical protein
MKIKGGFFMRRSNIHIYFILFYLLLTIGISAQTWQAVVPGIDYRYYRFESPQNDVFVTRMDRTTTTTIIDGSIANGKITQNGVGYNAETIPSQVARYNGAFGFWGRETARYRYKVIAAINGSGFSTANGCPDSAMVMNGAMIKRTFGSSGAEMGGMGFLYKLGSSAPTPGTPYMAGDLQLPPDPSKNRISFTDASWLQYYKINDKPLSDSIILYTHHYGAKTPATTGVTEFVIKMLNAQPLRINPWSSYTRGDAIEIKKNSGGQTLIPFDCIVIVASGSFIDDVEAKIPTVGTEVRFSLETKDTGGLDWTSLYCGIGAMWGVILRGGVKPTTSSPDYYVAVHPRTAAAFNSSYIYFIVVDGRSGRSTGMTLNELADFCINYLGATDAVNNDGGGSSTIWVNGQVKNVPSDLPDHLPRAVANGLMMIQLQPKEVSTEYTPSQTVYANNRGSTLYMRTGPGNNFHTIQTLANNTELTIVSHSLNGLRAQDAGGGPGYWWNVRTAGNVEGWVCGYNLGLGSGLSDWTEY